MSPLASLSAPDPLSANRSPAMTEPLSARLTASSWASGSVLVRATAMLPGVVEVPSSTRMEMLSPSRSSAAGSYPRVASAALASAMVPSKVIEDVPSAPLVKVRPVTWARLIAPSAESVTDTVVSSTSASARPAIVLPVEFTAKLCAPGSVRRVASFAPLTVTVAVALAVPPNPSSTVYVKLSLAVSVSSSESKAPLGS